MARRTRNRQRSPTSHWFTGVGVDRTTHSTTTASSTPSTHREPHVRSVSKLSKPTRITDVVGVSHSCMQTSHFQFQVARSLSISIDTTNVFGARRPPIMFEIVSVPLPECRNAPTDHRICSSNIVRVLRSGGYSLEHVASGACRVARKMCPRLRGPMQKVL